jgi:TonB-like protein
MNRVVQLGLLATALFLGGRSLAQSDAKADDSKGAVVLVKLSEPVYPTISRTAHVSGDIVVMLGVHQDGSIEFAEVISGPPLLREAALQSARQSQFECRKCSDGITPYQMVYTFQLNNSCDCDADSKQGQPPPGVTQSENHVTLVAQSACLCDPSAEIVKVRSAKCLYLWKCGVRYAL